MEYEPVSWKQFFFYCLLALVLAIGMAYARIALIAHGAP